MIVRGISLRIALATMAGAAIGLVIMALGVLVIGGDTFSSLMVDGSDGTEHARAMYDQAVTRVVILAGAAAFAVGLLLALALGRRLGRPLMAMAQAAQRLARGDYAIRVPRAVPAELVSLADSFNQMAADLEAQEQVRRDFIVNAAHELRTPLTNLNGYLEALRDGVIQPDPDTFSSLLDESDRLVRLSQSLEALADHDTRRVREIVEPIDLTAAVTAAAHLAQPAAERNQLQLVVEATGPVLVRASPDDLAQILGNLLSNAIRYSTPGGSIKVRVQRRRTDALVSVINPASIASADLPRIFERFYRVEKSRDRARGGVGIGLAVVKLLVEAWGGHVGVESAEGETRFWFSVPA
jgi:signal transduction histidine kinase